LSAKYDEDFFAWTEDQARALREAGARRENAPVDWENVAEEIESVGKSDRRALESRLTRLIEHLLKLEWSPAGEPRAGWRRTVREQRREIALLLEDSPSLRGRLRLETAYVGARVDAVDGLREDGVSSEAIPTECPHTLDQVLDAGWWPESRAGVDDGSSSA